MRRQRGVDGADVLEAGVELQCAHFDQWTPARGAQALGCRAAIGADQAAGAELDAAVPARDHHADLVVALAVDRREDRAPRGARRFAVVAGPVFGTDAIGPAVVGRIAVGAGGEEGEGDVDAGRGRGLRMEAAVADLDRVRGRRGERVASSGQRAQVFRERVVGIAKDERTQAGFRTGDVAIVDQRLDPLQPCIAHRGRVGRRRGNLERWLVSAGVGCACGLIA